ncbi:MAG: N-6 DNA methylase [Candidatus Micrarchaeota archaeon]
MSSGTNVEDTHSSDLTALLKKTGLNATFKKSYNTPVGRREPDITIQLPEGIALVEAKSPPAGLTKAMSQVNEYRQSVGATERIIAVFAVVYSNGIKKEIEVYYSNEHDADLQKFKTLEKLAEFIFEKTQEKPSHAEPQPISTQKVIAILNDNVASIRQSLSKASAQDIEGLFGGRDFFSTVLDYDQEDHVSDAALKNAAAYLLVNQVLFYQVLAKEVGAYKPIDVKELKTGNDLQTKYFNAVLRVDYKPVFGFNVAATIKDAEGTEALCSAIQAIQLLSTKTLNHDLLGKIFHNLIPLSLRKIVAAYYTNSEAAELLSTLAVEKKNEKVFDPACGSGTLLVAAYNRKKGLYEKFSNDQHVRFLENEIYGCDIMPFAAHLAAVNLALQAPLSFTNKVNVAIRDSTELAPGTEVASAQKAIHDSYKSPKLAEFSEPRKPKPKKGVVDLLEEERDVELPKFDVVIMNPPFTRFQRIPPHFKKMLAERFKSKRYKGIVHGQMGLHGYFLLLADKFVEEDGRIAAVLPLTTLSLEGFYGIIRLLLSQYQIEHVIASSGRSAFSENTSLREILLVARKGTPVPETRTKFTFIHASPEVLTVEKARQIAEKIKSFDNGEEYNDDFYIRQVNQMNYSQDVRALYQNITLHSPELVRINSKIRKWFRPNKTFCDLAEIEQKENWRISENPRGVEKLGYYALSLLAPKEEGKALKDHDVWVVEEETTQLLKVKHRFNGQAFRIPRNCTVPQFRRFSGQTKIRLEEPLDYLVVRRFDGFDEFLKASALADEKMQQNILRSIREGEWEKFVAKNTARIFAFYRGDITATGTNLLAVRANEPTFAGPGGSWVFHAPSTHDKLTQMWLNSTIAFYYILRDRKETRGGFVELDKYVFLNMPYPLQEKIDEKKLETLEKELSRAEFPSLLEQFQRGFEPRRKLDLFFLELAGVEKEEAEKFLKLLYVTMAKELLRLKGVMGG